MVALKKLLKKIQIKKVFRENLHVSKGGTGDIERDLEISLQDYRNVKTVLFNLYYERAYVS